MNRDGWIAVAVALAGGFFAWHLLSAPQEGGYFRPTTLPLAFAVTLIVLALALFGWSLARPAGRTPVPGAPPDPERAGAPARVSVTIVATVLYVVALPWLGYLVSSAAYFGALSLLFGNRRPVSIVVAMILIPVALFLFFEKYMIVLLPSARLFG
jgi:putative tricarboxylic transport membrane protein